MKQDWYTPSELACLGVRHFPNTTRGINKIVAAQGWKQQRWGDGKPKARRRTGKGGGFEYHYSLLPDYVQRYLILSGRLEEFQIAAPVPAKPENWESYDALPQSIKDKALARMKVMSQLESLRVKGVPLTTAKQMAAKEAGISLRTLDSWYRLCRGLRRTDWLPALAPAYAYGELAHAQAGDPAMDYLKSDYLRPEQPSFSSCYRRLVRVANAEGWTLPSKRTLLRRINAIPESIIVAKRLTREATKQLYRPQERDRSVFQALEAVNTDGHKWDVFVQFDKASKPTRPMMIAIQDLYSGKILAWRLARTENSDVIRLTFGDMFRQYGIPAKIWMDNGKGFAAKCLTAGPDHRFRGRVKAEDPVGVFNALGCEVRFTTPYSGQSKPIERAFRDMCDDIARHPAFAGAYTGNKIDAKPENYGSRAIPIDEFEKVVAVEIAEHNARAGRRSKVCDGLHSFNDVFEASYQADDNFITRASEAQLTMCMLTAEKVKPNKRDGSITLFKNRYWSEAMPDLRSQYVVVRFDPDDLTLPINVYSLDGRLLASAELVEMAGYENAAAAREHGRKRRAYLKSLKEVADAEAKFDAARVAAMLPEAEDELPPSPKKIVQLVNRGASAAAKAQDDQEQEEFEAKLARGLERIAGADLRIVE